MKKMITSFQIHDMSPSPRSGRRPFDPGLEYTIRWFQQTILRLELRALAAESSLRIYRVGFWALALILVAFVCGAILEGWS